MTKDEFEVLKQQVVAEETLSFIKDNREAILRRAMKRLKEMRDQGKIKNDDETKTE